ncbi:MAG: glycosyltransferase family 2 protein, partial [Clostridium sp.]
MGESSLIIWASSFYLVFTLIVMFIFVISSSLVLSKYLGDRRFEEKFIFEEELSCIRASILVPAFNEELTICETVESLLSLDYEDYEIIVISDGSRDDTVKNVKEKYGLKVIYKPMKSELKTKEVISVFKGSYKGRTIMVIDKYNGGKADALNVGINYSSGEIFVAVDADSMLQRDSLKNIVKPFLKNKNTIGVGG